MLTAAGSRVRPGRAPGPRGKGMGVRASHCCVLSCLPKGTRPPLPLPVLGSPDAWPAVLSSCPLI